MPDAETKREAVAFALFEHMYEGAGDDWRDFARRLWDGLTTEKRSTWYREADVALAAMLAA